LIRLYSVGDGVMSIENWWNGIQGGETEALGNFLTHCHPHPPLTLQGMASECTRNFAVRGRILISVTVYVHADYLGHATLGRTPLDE